MKPQELIDGLKYLADQAPIDAVLFRVPSAPACTDHNMRLAVSPRDVLDLLEYVQRLEDYSPNRQTINAVNTAYGALSREA